MNNGLVLPPVAALVKISAAAYARRGNASNRQQLLDPLAQLVAAGYSLKHAARIRILLCDEALRLRRARFVQRGIRISDLMAMLVFGGAVAAGQRRFHAVGPLLLDELD